MIRGGAHDLGALQYERQDQFSLGEKFTDCFHCRQQHLVQQFQRPAVFVITLYE